MVEEAVLLEDLVVEVAEERMLLQAKHNLDSNARGTRMTHLIECKWLYVTRGCCVTSAANGVNIRLMNAS